MLEHLHEWVEYSQSFSSEEYVWGAALAIVGVVGIAYGVSKIRKRKGKATMARDADEKELISEMLCNGLLDLAADGKLSARRVNVWHEKFSKQHGLWDLQPRKLLEEPPHPEDLKEEIRTRNPSFLSRLAAKTKLHKLVLKRS